VPTLFRLCVLVLLTCMAGPRSVSARPAAPQPDVLRDVHYVVGGTPDQVLDLYSPSGRGFPTVIFIHGGSLQEVAERRTSPVYATVCEPFVAARIGCATIDYRLAPTSKWPAMPNDAAAAVKWVKTNIAAHGGDPSRIFVFGHSSGCHLAAILGANPKYLATVSLEPSDLAGIIAMGCVLAPLEDATTKHTMDELRARWPKSGDESTYGTLDERLDSDPSRFIGPHMPPTIVIVAEAERFFPAILEQGAKFVRRLLELKRPADVILVPGKHMTSIANITAADDPTFLAIMRFIENPAKAGEAGR
jgi:acetyl esterase/lipase